MTGGNADEAIGDNSSGGGIFNDQSSPTIEGCTFSDNTATSSSSGGMYNGGSSDPSITNCTFSGNTTGSGYGGGIYNSSNSSPSILNTILWDNGGGEILNYDAGPIPVVSYSVVQGAMLAEPTS
ncbi:MAG: right-handed parallel beta-helix repeat-containing protein [Actinomycetota bacterium]|nr:right-handed parallel beta-helix repeat-containing protein [Actinomycetota bacterium]